MKAHASAAVYQAFASITNFAFSLYLVRVLSPTEFGVYVVVFAAVLLNAGVVNALIFIPLAARIAGLEHSDAQKHIIDALAAFLVYSGLASVTIISGALLVFSFAGELDGRAFGEAQQNTSHLYQQGLSRDDYIDLSGGLTRRADRKLIYVVRASGAVITGGRSRWLGSGQRLVIQPGDTIVIPLETDRIRPLTFWTNVTQILYQGAIAVAAIRTFD